MDLSEAPKAEIQNVVRKHLEDFERHLNGELTEKLTERKHSTLDGHVGDVS